MKCLPARALNMKTFSVGYWQWQHWYLVDAMRQYGFPSVFITISPYEWTFPVPQWLQRLHEQSGHRPTNMAAFETLHFAHTLDQLIRGYICGSNSQLWQNHLLRHNWDPNQANINTYFYRFEFQQHAPCTFTYSSGWKMSPTWIIVPSTLICLGKMYTKLFSFKNCKHPTRNACHCVKSPQK